MRARRREINIFNMSLLDILCGALGAFCFMMLVALPYYRPSGNNAQLRENQEKTQELLRDIEKFKDRLNDPAAQEELAELLRQLQAQVQSLQGQVNQLTAEKQQLEEKNDQLTAANDKQKLALDQKRPFLTVLTSNPEDQGIDLYLQDDMKPEGGGKSANPRFDPSAQRHYSGWQNDQIAYLEHRGVAMWVTSDAPSAAHFKVYAKLANEMNARAPTEVTSVIVGNIGEKGNLALPTVTLTAERFWTLIGTVTVNENNKLLFKEATAAERDAEWKEIAKTAPPSVVKPSPTAAAASSSAPPDDRRGLAEKMRKERQQNQPAAPSAGPSNSSERQNFIEKRQDRQLQTTPSPSATP